MYLFVKISIYKHNASMKINKFNLFTAAVRIYVVSNGKLIRNKKEDNRQTRAD